MASSASRPRTALASRARRRLRGSVSAAASSSSSDLDRPERASTSSISNLGAIELVPPLAASLGVSQDGLHRPAVLAHQPREQRQALLHLLQPARAPLDVRAVAAQLRRESSAS